LPTQEDPTCGMVISDQSGAVIRHLTEGNEGNKGGAGSATNNSPLLITGNCAPHCQACAGMVVRLVAVPGGAKCGVCGRLWTEPDHGFGEEEV